jgi:cobaltochelatase CobS
MDTSDRIECRICHKTFEQLSVHLASKHGINVAQYLQKFPSAPTVSEKASAAIAAARGKVKPAKPDSVASVAAPVMSGGEVVELEKPTVGLRVRETLKIGSARVPVFEGWGATDLMDVPDHDKHYIVDEILLSQLAIGLELMENVLTTGPTGVGKTASLYELAAILNWPVTRMNFNGDTRASDVIGDMVVVIDEETGQAKTEWKDGPLVSAMRRGHIFLCDELDAAPPAVHFVMQRVTERHNDPLDAVAKGKPHATLLLPTGEIVGAAPTFRIVATANTVGTGDMSGDYAATNVLNAAFLDRFGVKIRVEYPTEPNWKKILVTKGAVTEAIASQIYKVAAFINKGKRDGNCRAMMSPRKTLTWARLVKKLGGDFRKSAELAILNGIDPQDPDHKYVSDAIKNVMGV